jgi:diguanylate cyclase
MINGHAVAVRFMVSTSLHPPTSSKASGPGASSSVSGWHGTPQQGLQRLQITVLPYCIGLASAYIGAMLHAVPMWAAHALCLWCGIGMLVFWLLLRSDLTEHWQDPALIFPQVLFGCGAVVLAYTLIDASRGLALLWLCLLMLFDIHRLDTRQLVLATVGSLALMLCATFFHDRLHDTRIDLVSEWISLGTGAIVMPVMRQVSLRSYKIRHQLLTQRAALARTVADLERASIHDALTGLFNRHHMQNLLDEEVRRLRRTEQAFCLAIIDLDHFKQINDRYGHAVGDAVLQAFAQVASDALPATDRLARWGGEEFLLLMPETGLPTALQRLDALQQQIRQHDWSGIAAGLNVSFSAGLCEPGGRVPLHRDLERADRALYKAKARGRAHTVLADRT